MSPLECKIVSGEMLSPADTCGNQCSQQVIGSLSLAEWYSEISHAFEQDKVANIERRLLCKAPIAKL
jgi:hypothetical protein